MNTKSRAQDISPPAAADMINDSFLGICVVALGTVVWLGTMLISDPEGVVRKALTEKKQ